MTSPFVRMFGYRLRHADGGVMGRGGRSVDTRVARLTGVTEGFCEGTRRDLTREQAVAELRAISTDPDVLARAASQYVPPFDHLPAPMPFSRAPYAEAELQLLLDAGADREAAERYAEDRRRRPAGFSLAALAESRRDVERPDATGR